MRAGAVAISGALMLAGCATAMSAAPDTAITPTAYELADARRGGMAMSVFALAAAGAGAQPDKPLASVALPVRGLANFARSLRGQFRDDTAGLPGSRARPEIWAEGSDFDARVTEFQAATAAMEAAVRQDDRAAFAAALASTKAACKACHDSYRVEP